MEPKNCKITIEAIKGTDGRYYVDCNGQMLSVNDNHISLVDYGYSIDPAELARFQEDYDEELRVELKAELETEMGLLLILTTVNGESWI